MTTTQPPTQSVSADPASTQAQGMTRDDACRLALRMAFDAASTQPDPCVANWTDADGEDDAVWDVLPADDVDNGNFENPIVSFTIRQLRQSVNTQSTGIDRWVVVEADEGSYSTIWLTPDVFVAAF